MAFESLSRSSRSDYRVGRTPTTNGWHLLYGEFGGSSLAMRPLNQRTQDNINITTGGRARRAIASDTFAAFYPAHFRDLSPRPRPAKRVCPTPGYHRWPWRAGPSRGGLPTAHANRRPPTARRTPRTPTALTYKSRACSSDPRRSSNRSGCSSPDRPPNWPRTRSPGRRRNRQNQRDNSG